MALVSSSASSRPRKARATASSKSFTASYRRRASIPGILLLYAGVSDWLPIGPSASDYIGMETGSLTAILGNCIMIALGLYMIWQSVSGGPALRMDRDGITSWNVLGRKSLPWAEVKNLKLGKHDYFGDELSFVSGWGPGSGRLLKEHITCYPKQTEATKDEIVAAARKFRPDLSL